MHLYTAILQIVQALHALTHLEYRPCRHGMVLNTSGTFVDQISLFPSATFDADMITDNPGTWLFHCHVILPVQIPMCELYLLASFRRYLAWMHREEW